LQLGEFGRASQHWTSALRIRFDGANNAQNQAQEAERSNASTERMVVSVIGGILMGAAKTPEQARQASVATQDALARAAVVREVSIDPQIRAQGLPAGTVLRTPVTADYAPFSLIVRLRNLKYEISCTATLVTREIAISNAHCLYGRDRENQTAAPHHQLMLVHEGTDTTTDIPVRMTFTHYGRNGGWDGRRENDWLILYVSDPRTYPEGFVFPQVLPETPREIYGNSYPLMLAGYSGDLAHGAYLTLHYNCQGRAYPNSMIRTNCETFSGSSGSAVLTRDKPYRFVAFACCKNTRTIGCVFVCGSRNAEFLSNFSKTGRLPARGRSRPDLLHLALLRYGGASSMKPAPKGPV